MMRILRGFVNLLRNTGMGKNRAMTGGSGLPGHAAKKVQGKLQPGSALDGSSETFLVQGTSSDDCSGQ